MTRLMRKRIEFLAKNVAREGLTSLRRAWFVSASMKVLVEETSTVTCLIAGQVNAPGFAVPFSRQRGSILSDVVIRCLSIGDMMQNTVFAGTICGAIGLLFATHWVASGVSRELAFLLSPERMYFATFALFFGIGLGVLMWMAGVLEVALVDYLVFLGIFVAALIVLPRLVFDGANWLIVVVVSAFLTRFVQYIRERSVNCGD